ncbi:MAG: DsbA family protein [Rhodobacterales bacterium]|nr:DsbA family protein [Rhodobacterales bacterium]
MSLRFALPLALCLGTPLAALDLGGMTDEERAAFRAEVRAYLIENPEVLMEAIAVLEERDKAAQAAADVALATDNAEALFNDGYSFVGGNPDGDITLVEFMDYRCGYCKRAFEEVNQLLEADGNIRFIVKELPILGEQSTMSAQFAIAVHQIHGDETYKVIHDSLMTLRSDISPDVLARLADTFGLDPVPIMDRMQGPEVAAVINQNRALAQAMQISGTPTFVLEDTMLRGYLPLAQMQQVVAQIREN